MKSRIFFILFFSFVISTFFSQEKYYLISELENEIEENILSSIRFELLETLSKHIEIIDKQNELFISEVKTLQETGQMQKTKDAYEKFKIPNTDKLIILKVYKNSLDDSIYISFNVLDIKGVTEFSKIENIKKTSRIASEIKNASINIALNFIMSKNNTILYDTKKGLPFFFVSDYGKIYKSGEYLYIKINTQSNGVLYVYEKIADSLYLYTEKPLNKTTYSITGKMVFPENFNGDIYEENLLLLFITDSNYELKNTKTLSELSKVLNSIPHENWEMEILYYTIEK